MISHRKGFQKVYDLPERILPDDVDTKPSTQIEYCQYLIQQGIRSCGLVREEEARYLRSKLQNPMRQALQVLLEKKQIIPLKINKIDGTYYSTNDLVENMPKRLSRKRVFLLCPFDNAIIQRKRVISLFNFDYKLECYVPAAKRQFGYFSIAVLYGDAFAGHLDLKVDRKAGTLVTKQFTLDPQFDPKADFHVAFEEALQRYASYNGVTVSKN